MNAAFKEWAVICEALGSGQQSVLIRKGGIAEGRGGFTFRENEFFLFPTWFHEQLAKTTLPEDTILPVEREGEVEIRYGVVVEWTRFIEDWECLVRLRAFHVLDDSVLEERFDYKGTKGVHVAFVRVFRLDPPLLLPFERRFGGCRSWLDLPELPDLEGSAFVSVLSDEVHAQRREAIEAALSGGG